MNRTDVVSAVFLTAQLGMPLQIDRRDTHQRLNGTLTLKTTEPTPTILSNTSLPPGHLQSGLASIKRALHPADDTALLCLEDRGTHIFPKISSPDNRSQLIQPVSRAGAGGRAKIHHPRE